MEQRPLRLGDIVDDYCPRERRITNHAVVVLFEDTIKQTRCTTCDHEHAYKDAKEPKRRKKDATSALYSQVLSGLQKPVPHAVDDDEEADAPDEDESPVVEPEPEAAPMATQADADPDVPQPLEDSDVWPMHRRLIRAQLPRTGNEPPAPRPIPEFTVRQPGARGQRQWGRHGNGNGNGNGNHGHGRHRGGHGQGGNRGRGGFEGRGGQGGGRPGGGGGRGRRSR